MGPQGNRIAGAGGSAGIVQGSSSLSGVANIAGGYGGMGGSYSTTFTRGTVTRRRRAARVGPADGFSTDAATNPATGGKRLVSWQL
jgi:hypothetical protein